MGTAADPTAGTTAERSVFARVVVGVDDSPEALEAARQAALLLEPGGDLTLLAAWLPVPPALTPVGGSDTAHLVELASRSRAEDALRAARDRLGATGMIVRGFAWQALIEEVERTDATVVAVGSHGQGRGFGILAGSTTTELVHKAPCSVLVARAADARFPRRIVVGVDGSPQSASAHEAARRLAERFAAELWPVVAHGGKGVDRALVAQIVDPGHEDLQDEPVDALLAAAADADLLVVGSRGLHGVEALGSVSERVAHRARCSVLVVRTPAPQS